MSISIKRYSFLNTNVSNGKLTNDRFGFDQQRLFANTSVGQAVLAQVAHRSRLRTDAVNCNQKGVNQSHTDIRK